MAISIRSQSFHDTLKEIKEKKTIEEQQQVIKEKGFDEKEFLSVYDNEYVPLEKKVRESTIKKIGKNTSIEEQDSFFKEKMDEELQAGSSSSGRFAGRVIGNTVHGIVNFADMLADTTDSGQKITNWIDKTTSELSDEYIPESAKKFISEIFDPYHGDSLQGTVENVGGQLAALVLPSTGLVKLASVGMRATTALSPASRLVISKLGRSVSNTIGTKATKIATNVGKGAGYGTAAAVSEPLVNDIDRLLKEAGSDPTGKTEQEKYLEYFKTEVPENIAIDAALGGLLPIAGAGLLIAGKPLNSLLGSKALSKLTSSVKNNKFSRMIRENLTSQRGVDDPTFSAVIKRDAASGRALEEADGLTSDLKKAVNKDAVLKGLSKEDQQDMLNDVLTDTSKGSLYGFSSEVQTIINKLRKNVDTMSTALKGNTVGHSNLQAILDKNLGVYLNRSYDVFDDPVFRKEMVSRIKSFDLNDTIVQDAANFIKSNIGQNTSDVKVKRILLSLIKESPEDVVKKELGALSKALTTSPSGVFKKRTSIPKELKSFYGEISDPYTQYSKTVEKLSRINAEVDFIDDIVGNLTAKGLAKNINDAPINFEDANKVFEDRLSKVFGRATGDARNALDGLYVDPTYAKIMREGLNDWADFGDSGFGTFMKTWMNLKGMSQAAKTVYNPSTHVANTLGQGAILLANGILPLGKEAKKAGVTTLKKLLGQTNEELGKYNGRLRELGITNSNVGLGMLRKNLQEAGKDPFKYMDKIGLKRVRETGKKVNSKILDLYQAEDDVFKIMHFEKTKNYLKKAYPNKTENELEILAAQRTRDLMPNYSQVSKAIKGLRASPLGDFLSFPAEMMRTTKNLAKVTLQDAVSGNSVLQKEAAKKLAGMTVIGMAPSMLMNYSQNSHGITNDDEDAINSLAPNFEAFSNRVYLSGVNTDNNGHKGVDYLRLGSLDPYDYLKSMAAATHQIINSVDLEGDSFSIENRPEFNKALTGLFENQMAPFIGTSMITDALLNVFKGRPSGDAFVPSTDYIGKGLTSMGVPETLSSVLSIALDPLTPGFTNFLEKRSEFNRSGLRSKSKSTINPSEVDWRGLLGFGGKRLDLSAGLNYQLQPFESSFNGAGTKVSKEIENPNASSDDIFNSYFSSQKDRLSSQEEMKAAMSSYRQLGFNNRDIVSAMSIGKNPISQSSRLRTLLLSEQDIFSPLQISPSNVIVNRQAPESRQLPINDMRGLYDSLLNTTISKSKE
jgi:hypothetical protein